MGFFIAQRFVMPKRIERQISQDGCGYHCIDTYLGFESYPIWGYGYTEEEAIEEADRQARRMFNYNVDDMQKSIDSGAVESVGSDIDELMDWINNDNRNKS